MDSISTKGRRSAPPKKEFKINLATALIDNYYMRELGFTIRKRDHVYNHKDEEMNFIAEDPDCTDEIFEFPSADLIVVLCRNKQRILKRSWGKWVKATNVYHDYTADVFTILSRHIPPDEKRSELEIEVLWNWVLSKLREDDGGCSTGIHHILHGCKKKTAVITALQSCRLERFKPGDGILFQGSMPRQEDGHFTILEGECEVLQFPEESMQLMQLKEMVLKKKWDKINEVFIFEILQL